MTNKQKDKTKAEDYCGNKRPKRKVLCQLKKGHKGSHRAIIFWDIKIMNKQKDKIIDIKDYYYNPNVECNCKAIFTDTHRAYCKRRQRPK
jgi:hypothetical protein